MKKWQTIALFVFLLLLLFSCGMKFYRALEPDFDAIEYLESKGYRSVRITGYIPDGRGCDSEDAYRFTFDAIPMDGKKRVGGQVCGDEDNGWYQGK